MRQYWGVGKTWQPNPDSEANTKLYQQWKKAVTRTFDWVD
jgi:glycerol kinase